MSTTELPMPPPEWLAIVLPLVKAVLGPGLLCAAAMFALSGITTLQLVGYSISTVRQLNIEDLPLGLGDSLWKYHRNKSRSLVSLRLCYFDRPPFHARRDQPLNFLGYKSVCKTHWKRKVTAFIVLLIVTRTDIWLHRNPHIVLDSIRHTMQRWNLSELGDGTRQAFVSKLALWVTSNGAIMVGLSVLLHTNKTAFSRTNTFIDKLITYAVERFILITVVVLVELVGATWTLAMDFFIAQLECNSLLAMLNVRQNLRSTVSRPVLGLANVHPGLRHDHRDIEQHRPTVIEIRHNVTTHRDTGSSIDEPRGGGDERLEQDTTVQKEGVKYSCAW
ncbi:uncharacterized protein STEHIDRAFT_109617 [Stereum hirsutum FP-91666 SS1]|uniref:uncharacterized protein n=1 Tax=Stereum hirsutum (strain FP-91666) TaxID=721885 RepID=UPI000440DCA6|nr:uncharacterized protein STEHIDRAFT_109617 [Stereum hirsutum FP-91666 SS1]EIM89436.1 hypothetical protein STEHIDRAFT_109617 [Stereum hirsutum FP-91666 SS1]